ncbi:E3 ubiquitin-protein ligase rha1b [Phtheirospermum japonicum]|uniref:E3 ubiquitin-protein ligase rha1b n=1 Tax=Phtheirospermum japonicum TaxID=374723 RepID=A0A830B9Y0_9LAMI|nr:E3 ubiquitin-protein ligase rha1b [Phtheirospermum japonicum]
MSVRVWRRGFRRLTNCRHIFHRSCLDRWMDHDQKTCPLCRTQFIPEEMQEAFNEKMWVASGNFRFLRRLFAGYYGLVAIFCRFRFFVGFFFFCIVLLKCISYFCFVETVVNAIGVV